MNLWLLPTPVYRTSISHEIYKPQEWALTEKNDRIKMYSPNALPLSLTGRGDRIGKVVTTYCMVALVKIVRFT